MNKTTIIFTSKHGTTDKNNRISQVVLVSIMVFYFIFDVLFSPSRIYDHSLINR